jgi:two-component system sensor histidine kinase PilS (NtrC family)
VQVLHQASEEPEHVELVGVTLREAERLNRIIKDFLEFARPTPFQPRAYDIGPGLDEMVRILRKSPEVGPGHQVIYESPNPPIHVMADPDRVRQVFWNLANNALKAMPRGGTLAIQVLPHAGDQVMIAFRDDGEGMDEETVRRYFQPFSGRFQEGAGLGAAIVYRIAEEHGGDVQVVSREGRGSEVRFILPRASDPGAGAKPLASESRRST